MWLNIMSAVITYILMWSVWGLITLSSVYRKLFWFKCPGEQCFWRACKVSSKGVTDSQITKSKFPCASSFTFASFSSLLLLQEQSIKTVVHFSFTSRNFFFTKNPKHSRPTETVSTHVCDEYSLFCCVQEQFFQY